MWQRGHSEMHCCSCVEGPEHGDRLGRQGPDRTGNQIESLRNKGALLHRQPLYLFTCVCCVEDNSYPELRMWSLADEHAFQLLVEAFHAAAQSRDQCRQGSERDGNWLSLRIYKQVKRLL